MIHSEYIKLALDLALRAKGKTSPNPIVGAVIVKNSRIISTGYHHRYGGDHAEIVALKKAKNQARGATLYVTLEPCGHFGKTPPCVDAIIESGIKEVIIGAIDPNPLNSGKSLMKLRRAGIKIKVGFLEKELKKVNESFIKFITRKMPFVVVKCAQTLDGKIATFSGQSQWITSQKSRDYAHQLRNDFDAILVGVNTVLKDDPYLNAAKKTKQIKKIVVDTTLRTALKANLFKGTKPENIFFATTRKASPRKISQFLAKGVNVIICPQQKEGVDLKWLLKELGRRGISNVLVEGGSKVLGSLFKAKLVDKVLVVIAPKIMGDETAISSVRGLRISDVGRAICLRDIEVKNISEDILVTGYVYGNR